MKNTADLQKENQLLREKIAAEKEKSTEFKVQISALSEHLRHLLQKGFGSSSEKRSVDPLGLFNEAEELDSEAIEE